MILILPMISMILYNEQENEISNSKLTNTETNNNNNKTNWDYIKLKSC